MRALETAAKFDCVISPIFKAVMSPEILPSEVVDGGFAEQQNVYVGESHEPIQRNGIALQCPDMKIARISC
jgi:hypothetical protein